MKIRNQVWIETDTHLVITLHEPYWSAWSKFGWPEHVEGLGLSVEAIREAYNKGLKIRVNVLKYGSYEINAKKAGDIGCQYTFRSRDKKLIFVISVILLY